MQVDPIVGWLLYDGASSRHQAGRYEADNFLSDDDIKTPDKSPVQQSPVMQKQLPPNRDNGLIPGQGKPVFPPMPPQSLMPQQEPLFPGELPANQIPGENGRPPSMPMPMRGMTPGMPRMPAPPAPMLRSPLAPKTNNSPPGPGLKPPPKTPSLKSPKPVSHSPSNKAPSQQSKSPPKSPPKSPSSPESHSMSMAAMHNYLNTADDEGWGGHPLMSDTNWSEGGFDNGPDWGHGDGTSHQGEPFGVPPPNMGQGNPGGVGMLPSPAPAGPRVADSGPNWQGSNPDMNDSDPLHSLSRRRGYIFHRLSLRN